MWSERYRAATLTIEDHDAKVEAISDEVEQDLRLLGATAIEDRLQDGVPETIADLKRAGIKVWVATGDKLETAIGGSTFSNKHFYLTNCVVAIGHSTNLIGREANIIVVRGGTHGRTVYEQMVRAVGEFFPESKILDDNGAVVEEELNVDLDKEKEKAREREREREEEDAYALQRFETGLSSIVGSKNGERPGGFVLVVDGVALEEVCAFLSFLLLLWGCGG